MGLSIAREWVFSGPSSRLVLAAIYAGVKSLTRATSQHNPSLGSDASDKEKKRQTRVELQELDSMYPQELGGSTRGIGFRACLIKEYRT